MVSQQNYQPLETLMFCSGNAKLSEEPYYKWNIKLNILLVDMKKHRIRYHRIQIRKLFGTLFLLPYYTKTWMNFIYFTIHPAGQEHSPVMWWHFPPFWHGHRDSHWAPWLPGGHRSSQLQVNSRSLLLVIAILNQSITRVY